MKKTNLLLSMLAAFLFSAIFIISAAVAQPGQGRPGHYQPPKARFDVDRSMKDNLARQAGRDIVIHLNSGATIQGYVKFVGDNLVHLERLGGGRDYYDALVRIEDITAIEARFRGDR